MRFVIIKEMLIVEQQKTMKIFLSNIFLSLPSLKVSAIGPTASCSRGFDFTSL